MKAPASRRRSRSNDGTPNRVSSIIPIDPRLRAKLEASLYEPIVRRKLRVFHGPKPIRGTSPVRFTDSQVLAIRKLREWWGLSALSIGRLMGVGENIVAPVVEWRNRLHLDPGPRPTPAPPIEEIAAALVPAPTRTAA
jgi:hypothetical protein